MLWQKAQELIERSAHFSSNACEVPVWLTDGASVCQMTNAVIEIVPERAQQPQLARLPPNAFRARQEMSRQYVVFVGRISCKKISQIACVKKSSFECDVVQNCVMLLAQPQARVRGRKKNMASS